ncbi:MAG: hypothetical protein L0220_03730 [Acidobacteria bacterium]|nr:hypothetical protein [Acidobacteriota bacterium]
MRPPIHSIIVLVLFTALATNILTLPAQEPVPDDPAQNPAPATALKEEKRFEAATLNLHRWGAVTIFHGLPSDRVNAIAEDARGLLYFGTDNGLVRYDGRNVETIPDAGSLPSPRILSLKLDSRGVLWIGTDRGAAHYRNDRVEVMAETRGQVITGIAASDHRAIALVSQQGEIIRYSEPPESLRSERGAGARLTFTKLDQSTHQLLRAPKRQNDRLSLNSVEFKDRSKEPAELLIGSSGRGILINSGSELREATIKPPRPYFVSSLFIDGDLVWLGENAGPSAGGLWQLKNGTLSRASTTAGAITTLHGIRGELWAGTRSRGVFLFKTDGETANLIEHLTVENTAGGLRSDNIITIFRDREGVIWFGTDRGICRYDRESFLADNVSKAPNSNFIRALLKSSSGDTFAGTNSGLFRHTGIDNDPGSWIEALELQGRSVYSLLEDATGTIWAGTENGLFAKAKDSPNFTDLSTSPEATITISGEGIAQLPPEGALTDEATSNIKSSTENLKPKDSVRDLAVFRGQIYAAIYERGIEKISNPNSAGRDGLQRALVLSDAAARRALCLAVEGDLALWYGTSKGELRRYDGSKTTSFSLPEIKNANPTEIAIRAISTDNRNGRERLWIGTSRGLFLREDNQIHEVFPEVEVLDLLTRDGVVWCATKNDGLYKYLPDKNLKIRFDTEQGLASQQVFALTPDGSGILIGTNHGIVRHQPSPAEPRLQIKRVVADKTYLPDNLGAELLLPHTQPNLLLEVTGLGSRTFPGQFQYEYILKTRVGEEIERKLTHDPQYSVGTLKSGGYRIVARAISRDLIYSPEIDLRFRIRSAPPQWTNMLLTALLGIAVGAAIWAFRQQRRLARANRALEETNLELHDTRLRLVNETEAERSRIARDLHDQTLSDLRHLLVLTDQLPATGNGEPSPSPSLLRREIESISNEIRHICEDLSPSVLENIGFIPALEWALSDAVAHLPPEEKFAYEFICDPELEDDLHLSHIEKIQIYRITQEALNNICRHAEAKRVKLVVRLENTRDLVIEIEDDGIGFDPLKTNKTGHGIGNIRTRANLIGALVSWQNANPGCLFKVRISGTIKSQRDHRDKLIE